jgi:hypothetical protein
MAVFAREALKIPSSVPVTLSPLGKRGSDRAYFRTAWEGGNTAILVEYDRTREENAYFADIAAFLADIGIPAPRVLRHDPAACLIAVEDLGDADLRSFREAPRETRLALYRKTLSAIGRLHSFPVASFPSQRVRLMEGFGPDLYRWERGYFMDRFVRDVCGIEPEPSFERELEAELSALAGRLLARGVCLIHRDLQSRNVMVRDGEPFFIDFQGMRKGCAFYDLGSLLCDPYVSFSEADRDELLSFYYALAGRDVDRAAFEEAFWEASAQRLMQALGAYGFLWLKKGLEDFAAHVPEGLANLLRATARVPSLPLLRELAERCRTAYGRRHSLPRK